MVSTNKYAWRPNLDDAVYWRGDLICVDSAPTDWPRASWSWVEDTLAGRTLAAQVRCVRLDGPLATDATLLALAESGALDHVTRLELASPAFTGRALRTALALPVLECLRCESMAISDEELGASATLRRVELFRCEGGTYRSLLRAAPATTAVEVALLKPHDADAVRTGLGSLSLRSLALRHMACPRDFLDSALASSHTTLESLTLEGATGLDSDEFLAAAEWPALTTLEFRASRIGRVAGHLPGTLRSLSLSQSEIRDLALDRRPWPPSLERLDLVGQHLSPGLVVRLCREPELLRGLGLGSGDEATRVLAALTASVNPALCELELGDGPGVGVWKPAPGVSPEALLPALVRLRVVGQMPPGSGESGWRVDHSLLIGALCGEVAPALEDLSMQYVALGNPTLKGGFAPALRGLELRSCLGFVEGLARCGKPHRMVRLVLDGVEVAEAAFSEWIADCPELRSLALVRVPGFGADGLAATLAAVAGTLLQLVLEGFNADGEPAYADELGNALASSFYPQLVELVLDDTSIPATALARLLPQGAPRLERLACDLEAMGQDALQTAATRAPSSLHWIAATGVRGPREALARLRDDPDGRLSSACIRLA
jgi:hypothetical protein